MIHINIYDKCSIERLPVDLSETNTKIYDSYKVRTVSCMKCAIKYLRFRFPINRLALNKRSQSSMIREWKAHNLLYKLHIKRSRTKDVDLNYPTSIWESIGYFILSLFYF